MLHRVNYVSSECMVVLFATLSQFMTYFRMSCNLSNDSGFRSSMSAMTPPGVPELPLKR